MGMTKLEDLQLARAQQQIEEYTKAQFKKEKLLFNTKLPIPKEKRQPRACIWCGKHLYREEAKSCRRCHKLQIPCRECGGAVGRTTKQEEEVIRCAGCRDWHHIYKKEVHDKRHKFIFERKK